MTCPSLRPHGGIRVIIEWANRLAERHDVFLRVPHSRPQAWISISPRVRVVTNDAPLERCDRLIVSSPHAARYLETPVERTVVFLQMLEHLFRPDDEGWRRACETLYRTRHPLVSISRWNIDALRSLRGGPTVYVGNGVNLDDFPVLDAPKDGRTVLVEGWNATNPTKDLDRIGPRVAARLKRDGYRVVAYAAQRPHDYAGIPDEFYVCPPLPLLNRLYAEATILLKATRCDARACAPVEAMTKGTVTARAIVEGDDDLTDERAIRVGYDEDALYDAALRLLEDRPLRERLSRNCLAYAKENTWERWMPQIEAAIAG